MIGARRAGVAAAIVAVVGLLLIPAGGALAATAGSSWWFDRYGVALAHSAGWTGDGVKVGVIDGQVDTTLPVLQGAGLTVHEPGFCADRAPAATTDVTEDSVHGTDVTALLLGNGTGTGSVTGIAPKAHVTFYSVAHADASGATAAACETASTSGGTRTSALGQAIHQAVADGNRIISISQVVDPEDGDVAEVAAALARGVVIVAGDGNHASQAGLTFPHGANGVVAVNALQEDGTLQADQGAPVTWADTTVVAAGVRFPTQADLDVGRWGDSTAYASGSSLATPLVAGMLAATLQKYPTATGDQLIQSLIRNTTVDDHALAYQAGTGFGYGPASLTHLLRVDPTTYPDTNPLMSKAGGIGGPTAAQVAAADAGGSSTTGGTATGGSTTGGLPAGLVPVLVVVGVLVIVVVAIVVIVVAVAGRRRRTAEGMR